ncbi:MAG: FkbM family methyltransferase, partial [Flavobacteriales bacterium]
TGLKLYLQLKVWKKDHISLPGYSAPIRIRKHTQDIHAFAQVFLQNEYQLDLPFTPKTIIDAGANVGYASLLFHSAFRDAEILAIEPDQSNFNTLVHNCSHIAKVKSEQKAIHCENNIQLQLIDSGLGSTGFTTSKVQEGVGGETVATISPKEILSKMNWESIDLFKIDIEGGEKALFSENTKEWLPKTKCVVIEFHERFEKNSSDSAFKALRANDFRFFDLVGENLIFLNEQLT